jgi:hypothetical protein
MDIIKGARPTQKRAPKKSPLDTDANVVMVKNWIISRDKTAGEERGLRVTMEDAKRMRLKHPGRTVALHLKRLIRNSGQPDMKVRIYNFPDRIEVWVSYEPRRKRLPSRAVLNSPPEDATTS